jgi:hypothetical protein
MSQENVEVIQPCIEAFNRRDPTDFLTTDHVALAHGSCPTSMLSNGGSVGASRQVALTKESSMRVRKRLLALASAIAAMGVFAASASGQPPENASCEGVLTVIDATSGALQNGAVAGFVHDLGHEVFADFQQELAHTHGSC